MFLPAKGFKCGSLVDYVHLRCCLEIITALGPKINSMHAAILSLQFCSLLFLYSPSIWAYLWVSLFVISLGKFVNYTWQLMYLLSYTICLYYVETISILVNCHALLVICNFFGM